MMRNLRDRRKVLRYCALGFVAIFSLAACSSPSGESGGSGDTGAAAPNADECAVDPADASPTVGIQPGSMSLMMDVLKEQGFDKDHGIDIQVKEFVSPPALAQGVNQKAVDIGFVGLTTVAMARNQGTDLMIFGPLLTLPSDGIFVPNDSPIESLEDLKGRKIGVFSGKTSSLAGITLKAVDPEADDIHSSAELVEAPDSALFGLLDSGELDAALVGNTTTIKTTLSGDYRNLEMVNTAWESVYGYDPVFVGAISSDEYAEEHCGVLKAYGAAQREAVDYIMNNDVWRDYSEKLGVTGPGAADELKKITEDFEQEWTDEEVASTEKFLEEMIGILGPDNYVSELPEGLITTEYWTD